MKEFLNWTKRNKIHFISWTIFISCEVLIVGLGTGKYGKPGNYIAHYILNICLFYFCGELLYPRVFSRSIAWIWKLPLSLGFVYGIYLLLNFIVDSQITKYTRWNDFDEMLMNQPYVFGLLWRTLQFIGFSGFYFLFKQYQKEVRDKALALEETYQKSLINKNMEIELNHARNAYLKAQINPHLLFNTLSFLYQDTLETAPKSAEAIMTLSDIMRYSINCEFTENTVPLKGEIAQVENLIKLHQIRFDGERYIDFQYDEKVKAIKFLPLVMITLVENIFKHGKLSEKEKPAMVSITCENEVLKIKTSNLADTRTNIESSNTGLRNIQKRLSLSYGNTAEIVYGIQDKVFSLSIQVSLSSELPI